MLTLETIEIMKENNKVIHLQLDILLSDSESSLSTFSSSCVSSSSV